MKFILFQVIDLMQYEIAIYVFSILFILFDIYIITKIVLLFKKQEQVNIDWKFASVNIANFILTYIFLIIIYVMLFKPSNFTISLLSISYRDGLHVCIIVLFITYFVRYLIFLLTIQHSFFITNENKIIFLNSDLSFNQIETINDKKGFIIVKVKKENQKHPVKTKIFLKKSKLSSILLEKKSN